MHQNHEVHATCAAKERFAITQLFLPNGLIENLSSDRIIQVKCDETKPECKRCVTKGVQCPGYTKDLKWSTKYEVAAPAPKAARRKAKALGSARQHSEAPSLSGESDSSADTETHETVIDFSDVSQTTGQSMVLRRPPTVISQQRMPTIMPQIFNPSCFLKEQYFQQICAIASMYDSHLNPFRVMVLSMMDDSPAVSYTIQSMAAAFIGWDDAATENKLYAIQHLQQILSRFQNMGEVTDEVMLVTFFLGVTACWHKDGDLGLEFLTAARIAVDARNELPEGQQKKGRLRLGLLRGMLDYWEMNTAMVPRIRQQQYITNNTSWPDAKSYRVTPLGYQDTESTAMTADNTIPHPWVGVAPRAMQLLKEAGELLRQCYEYSPDSEAFGVPPFLEGKAEVIEEELLGLELPPLNEIQDAGDDRTPGNHYLVLADCYRLSTLLLVYSIFPALLSKRLGERPEEGGSPFSSSDNMSLSGLEELGPFTPFGSPFLGAQNLGNSSMEGSQEGSADSQSKTWLMAMALHVLRQLNSLPPASGTHPAQTILLVICSNALAFSDAKCQKSSTSARPPSPDDDQHDRDVRVGRDLVLRKLETLKQWLPPRQLHSVYELINQLWKSLDEGQKTYWFKVMADHKLEVILG